MQFNLTPAVKNLLIINVIFFIATISLKQLGLVEHLSAFYFDSPFFKFWQPITYLFMHGSFEHLLFNMIAVFMFGTVIEQTLGIKRFIEYYFITGLGALALHMFVQGLEVYSVLGSFTANTVNAGNVDDVAGLIKVRDIYSTPVLGASGAVFGILLAFGYLFPNAEVFIFFIPIPVKAKYVVTGYMLIELVLGVRNSPGDSVAHFAHIGGALFGFILLKIWGYRSSRNFY
ncbi:rhomboid family intramembrane serine protease [Mucilaginibacter defluvii]|uniref:Rhomboid family intramembrane serine protease n=1 Tax=Mucilaginibacter defluvii TaxID=1196019 RepID=A0ABP9G993_9SPHI